MRSRSTAAIARSSGSAGSRTESISTTASSGSSSRASRGRRTRPRSTTCASRRRARFRPRTNSTSAAFTSIGSATAQAHDVLVFEKRGEKEVVPLVHVTADDRHVVITAQRGASDDSEVYLIDRETPDVVRPLFTGFDAAYDFIEASGGVLYFRTTQGAPRGRIISVDPREPQPTVREVVAESATRLSTAVISRDGLYAVYLENASDRVARFALDGTPGGSIGFPDWDRSCQSTRGPIAPRCCSIFTSFTEPPGAWVARAARRSPPEGRSYATESELGDREPDPENVSSFQPSGGITPYQTRQVWYASKDGTRVSMFLVHKADLPRDGNRPVYSAATAGSTSTARPLTIPAISRCSIAAASSRWRTCAAAASTARSGIAPACSNGSRTSSTTSSRPPSS